MRKLMTLGALLLGMIVALTACAGPSATSKGFAGGGAAGAAVGCGVGGIVAGRGGCALGAALGGGVGALIGALAGHASDQHAAEAAAQAAAARQAGQGSCRWVQKRDSRGNVEWSEECSGAREFTGYPNFPNGPHPKMARTRSY